MKKSYLLLLLLLLASCRTQTVVLPERHTEYIHDTILRADSVYVSHYLLQRGDTIWMTDTVLKYLYRDKVVEVTQHDNPIPGRSPGRGSNPDPSVLQELHDCLLANHHRLYPLHCSASLSP